MFELFRPYLKGASKVLIVLKRYSLYLGTYTDVALQDVTAIEILIIIIIFILFAKVNPNLPQDKSTFNSVQCIELEFYCL